MQHAVLVQEEATVQVMHAIISPRTLHELCRVALDSLEAADLEAGPTAELLTILLIPGSLLSLRNLILGRCVHIALTLPRVAPQVVAMASTVSGQVWHFRLVESHICQIKSSCAFALKILSVLEECLEMVHRSVTNSVSFQAVLDNLAAENALDCALAAAHLFTACSDASLLTKQHRLAVLCAAALREAREGLCGNEALAAAAVTAAVKHLRMVHASADAAGGAGSGVATGVVTSMVSLAVRHSTSIELPRTCEVELEAIAPPYTAGMANLACTATCPILHSQCREFLVPLGALGGKLSRGVCSRYSAD